MFSGSLATLVQVFVLRSDGSPRLVFEQTIPFAVVSACVNMQPTGRADTIVLVGDFEQLTFLHWASNPSAAAPAGLTLHGQYCNMEEALSGTCFIAADPETSLVIARTTAGGLVMTMLPEKRETERHISTGVQLALGPNCTMKQVCMLPAAVLECSAAVKLALLVDEKDKPSHLLLCEAGFDTLKQTFFVHVCKRFVFRMLFSSRLVSSLNSFVFSLSCIVVSIFRPKLPRHRPHFR
jgi:hypothetical protein